MLHYMLQNTKVAVNGHRVVILVLNPNSRGLPGEVELSFFYYFFPYTTCTADHLLYVGSTTS